MKHIGFTGTREGMTFLQKTSFIKLVEKEKPFIFHHGNCIGSDEEAHQIVMIFANKNIIIHPPLKKNLESCVDTTKYELRERKEYLTRDREIVDEVEFLIGCPKDEQRTGGTWYTINYAIRQGKKVFIIDRLGNIKEK